MTYFLLVYDRPRGEMVVPIEEFDDQRVAMTARLERELQYRNDPNIEVVVLGAENREVIEHTHSRYFGLRGLLAR